MAEVLVLRVISSCADGGLVVDVRFRRYVSLVRPSSVIRKAGSLLPGLRQQLVHSPPIKLPPMCPW